jgi:glycine/D-amino acid oxidase-like deaminating enzyme
LSPALPSGPSRRAFLAGSGAALLSGCVTTRVEQTGCTALPKVAVDPSRVLRSVAGLRPWRAGGFRVEREPFVDKTLVHNYGHGGSGITFSWGTARLAADLGLQGHAGPVAVLGAGVVGLTTARLVQEAGFPVTIYTAALPRDTTSWIAGGQIMPSSLFRESVVTPQWFAQFDAALDYSIRRFEAMRGEEYGVRTLPTFIETQDDEPPRYMKRAAVGWRHLGPGEHPFPLDRVVRYETLYVETGRFLQQLTRDVLKAGGNIRLRRFATPAELGELKESLVFNCTGLGARDLFGDQELVPIRGQLAILQPQPEVRYAFTGRAGYMFPRADGIILGGTFERNEWSAVPEPETIAGIVTSHQQLMAGFRCTA